MRPRIEPRIAAPQTLNVKLPGRQIRNVDIRNLQFPACRGANRPRDVHNVCIVEVKSRHRIVGLRMLRFFLQRGCIPHLIKGNDAVPFRIRDVVGKDRCACIALHSITCAKSDP